MNRKDLEKPGTIPSLLMVFGMVVLIIVGIIELLK